MDLDFHVASASERQAAFANVFDVWKWGATIEEHLRNLSGSGKHAQGQWYVGRLDGRVVVSLGCYPLEFQFEGAVRRGFAIGSVHTLAEFRGQGLASRLLDWVEQAQVREGAAIGLLYTDIQTTYYERLGYQACPSLEGWWELAKIGGSSSWRVELATSPVSIDDRAAIYAQDHGQASISIHRAPDYWAYLDRKSPDGRIFWLHSANGERLGYARCRPVCGDWRISDLAVLDREQNLRLAYDALGSYAAANGAARLGGWIPDDIVSRERFQPQPRPMAVTMLKSLAGAPLAEPVLRSAHQFCEIDHV